MGATILEEFVGKLGWQVDKAGPNEFKKQTGGIVAGFAKISAAYTAVAGVVTGFLVQTNATTAATYRLAQSMGVSYDWLDRWGDAGKAAGIGIDNVRTASYFLNKTLGASNLDRASGQAQNVAATLRSIGLNFEDLKNASPQDTFNKVAFAIGNTEDRATAANAASKLFGRMGGQQFSRLGELARANGQTVEEFLNRFKDLEFETEQSAAGAKNFTASWDALASALDEIKAAFAGLIGEALTPILKDVRAWVAANRELLKQKIVEWARSVAKWLKDVWGFFYKIAGVIGGVIGKVGGLSSALEMILFFYLGSKFISATKNVDDLGVAFGKVATKAELAAAKTGLLKAGLLAVAAIAFDDLLSSIDDISNESWGNRIARTLLRLGDQAVLWVADMQGAYFKSDADRATFIAAQSAYITAGFTDAVTNIGIFIENIKNAVLRGVVDLKSFVATTFGGADPKKAKAAADAVKAQYKGSAYSNTKGEYAKAMIGATGQAKDLKQRQKDLDAYARANVTTNNSVFNIHPSPGMNETDLANKVNKHIEKNMKRAVRQTKATNPER